MGDTQKYSEYRKKLRNRVRTAKQAAMNFAIENRLIEFEKINTGSTDPDDNIRMTQIFGRYFEKRDVPETITRNSGRTYIFSMPFS